MAARKKPLVLLILDGWGYREDTNNNAIAQANTPVMDKLWQSCPHTLISGSGLDVGLPDGQMGNSEVGHVNLGSGRVVYQDFTRITKAISDGDFFTNPVLTEAVAAAKQQHKHLMHLRMQSTKLPRNKGPQQTIHSLIHELHPAPSDPGCEFPSHENSNPT